MALSPHFAANRTINQRFIAQKPKLCKRPEGRSGSGPFWALCCPSFFGGGIPFGSQSKDQGFLYFLLVGWYNITQGRTFSGETAL